MYVSFLMALNCFHKFSVSRGRVAGRSGTEKLPESPDSTMTDSPFLFEMPDATNLTDCKCRKILSSKDLNLQADPILNVEAAMAAFPIVFQEPSEELPKNDEGWTHGHST